MKPAVLTARNLEQAGIDHAFFTRIGGVSEGLYATLNGGVGSNDRPDHVVENRARMAAFLGVEADHLLVPFQIHSADAQRVEGPWKALERPRCDGLVTKEKGLALGVTGADCGMLLFADVKAQIIGACHAGWKGALTGMIEATVTMMERSGAQRRDIHVALGPTIGPMSYEVGSEFVQRFIETDNAFEKFFTPSQRADHAMFNLPAFIASRIATLHVASFEDLGVDTYRDDARCYSFRRSTHRHEADYGRLVSAIALL